MVSCATTGKKSNPVCLETVYGFFVSLGFELFFFSFFTEFFFDFFFSLFSRDGVGRSTMRADWRCRRRRYRFRLQQFYGFLSCFFFWSFFFSGLLPVNR